MIITVETLRQYELFDTFDDEELVEIIDFCYEATYAEGERYQSKANQLSASLSSDKAGFPWRNDCSWGEVQEHGRPQWDT